MFHIKVLIDNGIVQHQWALQDEMPKVHPHAKVVHFDATGEGLNYIMLRFRNLPTAVGRSCVWQQPWAQFIFDNLKD